MYRHYIQLIQKFLGDGLFVWLIPAIIIIAIIVVPNLAWRRKIEADKKAPGIWALLRLFFTTFLDLTLGLAALGILVIALLVQHGLFSEKHGRVTDRNAEAVRSKWGIPHEQYDLSVRHYVMQTKKVEVLANDTTKEIFLEEREPAIGEEDEIIISEEVLVNLTEEEAEKKPSEVVRRITKKVRREVKQDSIPAADVNIIIKSNPRQLGGAVYPGYDDQWLFNYQVENRSAYSTQAVFRFPVPGEGHGIFDRLIVRVNGTDYLPQISYHDGDLEWRMVMKPIDKQTVDIGYNSRGLEYFRYRPSDMRQHCKVAVKLEGVDSKRLNFPIGSMPPMDDLKTISGDNFTLNWDLSRAVTNLDIGVMIPVEPQPGYYITRILWKAPIGLALMCLIIFVTRRLLGAPFALLPLVAVGLSYYITNILLANLNDIITSFTLAFILSTVPITIFVFIFWWLLDNSRFMAVQSGVIFGLFSAGYPLAMLAGAYSGTILHIEYLVLLVYAMILLIFQLKKLSGLAQ